MCKRIVLVAAVMLAACGTDTSKQAGPDQGPTDLGGGVPIPALVAGTVSAKVIVRRSDTRTIQNQVFDDNGDPVLDANGQPVFTTTTVFTEVFRYVTNINASTQSILIPEGTNYTIEVVAGAGVQPPHQILGYYRAEGVTVPVPTGFAIPLIFSTPIADVSIPVVRGPLLAFSPIYVGLAQPPYDKYYATAGLAFPFNGAWTMTCGGAAGAVAGNRVTFTAPAANGSIACNTRIHLASALMQTGEAVDSWELSVDSTATPIPSSSVPIPQ